MDMDSSKALRELEQGIRGISKKDYLPSGLVTLIQKVQALHIEARANARVILPPDSDLAAPEMRAQGAPMLDRAKFPVDREQAEILFVDLLAVVKAMGAPLADAAREVDQALARDEFTVDEALDAYLADDAELFKAWAERTPEAPSLLRFLAQSSASPSIEAVAQELAKLHTVKVWNWGHCPVCGQLPFMAELRGKEGARHLSCSFCRTHYRVKRIACPYCGEEEFDKLSFFTAKEEPGFRVDVCKSCNMYIKTTDFRELDRKSSPLLDDLDSLVMDMLAADKGFLRPTASGWGF